MFNINIQHLGYLQKSFLIRLCPITNIQINRIGTFIKLHGNPCLRDSILILDFFYMVQFHNYTLNICAKLLNNSAYPKKIITNMKYFMHFLLPVRVKCINHVQIYGKLHTALLPLFSF